MYRRLALTAAILAMAVGTDAMAQEKGFYVERFEPMPAQGMNLLNLGSSEVLGHLLPSAGIFLQYVNNPLQLIQDNADEDVLTEIVKDQFRADVWVALGIANIIDIGLVVPLILDQSSGDLSIFARGGQAIESTTLGDIRVIPKIRIINPDDAGGFGLAAMVAVSLPTGSQEDFTSDGSVRVEPRLVLDWTDRSSGFSVVGNIGYHVRPKTEVHNLVIDDAITWGAGVRIPTPIEQLKVVGSVFGAIPLEENRDPITFEPVSDSRSTSVEIDAAIEVSVGDIVLNAGGGAGLTEGYGSPSYRIFASLGYVPRCVDNDGDGICNQDDQCPDEPEDFDGFQDSDGCPDLDNDGDGIPDVRDGANDPSYPGFGVCRGVDADKANNFLNTAEDIDGFEDEDGCPDHDNDGDGILDVNDGADDPSYPGFGVCRGVDADKANNFQNTAEDKDGFEDQDGCPDPDNDGDGILDVHDGADDPSYPGFGVCRGVDADKANNFYDTAEDIDGFEDEDGCPDHDNDKDGQPDVSDGPAIDPGYPGFGICRDAPGLNEAELIKRGHQPPWVWQDAKKPYPGCPMVIAECVCGQIIITQMVNFKYGSAALDPSSYPLLDEVARVLNEKQCASSVRVEGHTDWHGSDRSNLSLSQRRVESVETYLLRKGVKKGRLIPKGYGESKPLDPKDSRKTCDRCTPGCTCEPGSATEPNPDEAEIRRLNRRVQFRILELTDPGTGKVDQCPVDY